MPIRASCVDRRVFGKQIEVEGPAAHHGLGAPGGSAARALSHPLARQILGLLFMGRCAGGRQ